MRPRLRDVKQKHVDVPDGQKIVYEPRVARMPDGPLGRANDEPAAVAVPPGVLRLPVVKRRCDQNLGLSDPMNVAGLCDRDSHRVHAGLDEPRGYRRRGDEPGVRTPLQDLGSGTTEVVTVSVSVEYRVGAGCAGPASLGASEWPDLELVNTPVVSRGV